MLEDDLLEVQKCSVLPLQLEVWLDTPTALGLLAYSTSFGGRRAACTFHVMNMRLEREAPEPLSCH